MSTTAVATSTSFAAKFKKFYQNYTFFGAIMLQMIEGILIAAKIPPFLTGLVKGIIIILAVLFQSKKKGKN